MRTNDEEFEPIDAVEMQGGNSQQKDMLQVKEVAELLGIHPNTVRIWTESGVLRAYRIGPRKDRRIPLEAVKSMLHSTQSFTPHRGELPTKPTPWVGAKNRIL